MDLYFIARPFVRPRPWMLGLTGAIILAVYIQGSLFLVMLIMDWAANVVWFQDVPDSPFKDFLNSTWYISPVVVIVASLSSLVLDASGPMFLDHPLVNDLVTTLCEALLFPFVMTAYFGNITGKSSYKTYDIVGLVYLTIIVVVTGVALCASVLRMGIAYWELRTWNRPLYTEEDANGMSSVTGEASHDNEEDPLLQAYREQESARSLARVATFPQQCFPLHRMKVG
ncbi:hypothetical protein V8E51_012994 [Hyaloscypha variabilis]